MSPKDALGSFMSNGRMRFEDFVTNLDIRIVKFRRIEILAMYLCLLLYDVKEKLTIVF